MKNQFSLLKSLNLPQTGLQAKTLSPSPCADPNNCSSLNLKLSVRTTNFTIGRTFPFVPYANLSYQVTNCSQQVINYQDLIFLSTFTPSSTQTFPPSPSQILPGQTFTISTVVPLQQISSGQFVLNQTLIILQKTNQVTTEQISCPITDGIILPADYNSNN